MNKIKGVVFDLDGTLIDSKDDVLDAFSYAFSKIGRTKPDDDVLIHTIGFRLEECFRPFLGDDEDLLRRSALYFREYYEKNYLNKTKPFEGVVSLIEWLNNSFCLAITTMKKGEYAREIIRNFGWESLFKVVVGAEEGFKAKPDPEMLLEAVKRLGLKIDEVIYIGDTRIDREMAKRANVDFIFVEWGYGANDFKEDNIIKVSKPEQIKDLLKGRV